MNVVGPPGVAHPDDAARKAETILVALAAPHVIGGHELTVGASIGISVFPEDGQTTAAQAAFLRAEACNEVQGYLFSPPLDAIAMEALLRDGPVTQHAEA